MPLSLDRSNRLPYRGTRGSRFSYPWSCCTTRIRWVRGSGFSVVTVLSLLSLMGAGDLALAIPDDYRSAVESRPILSGVVDNSSQVLYARSSPLTRGQVSIRLLAEAPVFRPDDGRDPRVPVESGRFRPDPRDESPPASRKKHVRGSDDGRSNSGWSDRQQGRFRPLPDKKRRYEDIYPPPAAFPPLAPEWRP